MNEYDLAIIGWGAAGFAAAIKASELTNNEMKIALIGHGNLGGTCVNVGCVPSKYLIEASKVYKNLKNPLYAGISGDGSLNFQEFMESLRNFVSDERTIKYENVIKNFKNVDLINGSAYFKNNNTVYVNDSEIRATNFIIATGSRPLIPDIMGLNNNYYTSDNIWTIKDLPEKIAILGSGEVAIELAYAFSSFGSEVHIFNRSNRILKNFDDDITSELIKSLKENHINFHLGSKIFKINDSGSGETSIQTEDGIYKGFSHILVATGRIPNIDSLNLDKAGIMYKNGIIVDNHLKTTNDIVYAAGDCVDQPIKLETLAGKQGVTAVNNILGGSESIDLHEVPWAVFCEPNVASIGYTEKELRDKNIKYSTRIIGLKNVVKANILKNNSGLAKIIADDENKILGIHVLAPNAAEFIIEGVYIIKNKLTYNDLINSMHIFPTVSESIKICGQSFIRDVSKMSCCMD